MSVPNVDQFEVYFRRADLDGDGRISGAEAVGFFQGSGLPKNVLAQVRHVTFASIACVYTHRFACLLMSYSVCVIRAVSYDKNGNLN